MKILEALNWGEAQLKTTANEKAYDVHNQKLDSQVLLSYCLSKPTGYLFTHFEDPLSEKILEKFERCIERRMRHEPIAYIIGRKSFYRRDFYVNPFVLIPRPETEQLIDLVKRAATERSTIIDVGTGSGAIAITLAAELNHPVVAIDIDQNSLAVAKHNAETHQVSNLISLLHGNLLQPYLQKNVDESTTSSETLIVANLPYAPLKQWEGLDPDVKKYEPKKAVTGGVDGLDLFDELLQQISTYRHRFPEKLTLFMEMDSSHELMLPRLVKEHFPKAGIEVLRDLASKPRVTIAQL